jgi:phage anti-repressor protein
MELVILESKKGTKVVSATNLYQVLQLPTAQYTAKVRRWMRDLYEFSDGGIRKPQVMRDYARRPRPGEPLEDYYITLELAKLISLRTTSKVKLKYARFLDAVSHNGQMSLLIG